MAKKISVLLVLVLALLAAPIASAQAASTDAKVYVVHGINGVDLGAPMALPVDISVNGACAITAFGFQQVAGPVTLPAGTYDIAISLANAATPCSNAPVISGPFTFGAGKTYTVIAHLTAAGAPTASQFTNDVSGTGRARTRVALAHTAYAPAVDVYVARGKNAKVLENVPNGAYASLALRPGAWNVWLTLPDASDKLFEAKFTAKPGTAYFNYVVGSAANGLYLVQIPVKTR